MDDEPEFTITREQTAIEEIESAIDLLFRGGSLISVNLLAWAAIDVITGVATSRKVEVLSDLFLQRVPSERKGEFFAMAKRDYNFAKHSDRDPERLLTFKRTPIEFSLFEAIQDYGLVYHKRTLSTVFYEAYFIMKHRWIADIIGEEYANVTQIVRGALGDDPTFEEVSLLYRDVMVAED